MKALLIAALALGMLAAVPAGAEVEMWEPHYEPPPGSPLANIEPWDPFHSSAAKTRCVDNRSGRITCRTTKNGRVISRTECRDTNRGRVCDTYAQ